MFLLKNLERFFDDIIIDFSTNKGLFKPISFLKDLSKLLNVLSETHENAIDYVAPHLDEELAEAFGDEISNKWINDLYK